MPPKKSHLKNRAPKPSVLQMASMLPADFRDQIFFMATGIPVFRTRPFTDDEWRDRCESFPEMKNEPRANCWVTRDAPRSEPTFDCVGYSVGELHTLGWDNDLRVVIEFYQRRGYTLLKAGADNATIDLWAQSNGTFAHASRRFPGPNAHGMPADLWESGPWGDQVFTHGRHAILSPHPVGVWHEVKASFG